MSREALSVIVSACRTPIGTFGGSLKDVSAADRGAVVVREALARGAVAADAIDDVVLLRGLVQKRGDRLFAVAHAAEHRTSPNGLLADR